MADNKDAAEETTNALVQTGSCHCGAVEFAVNGSILMNAFCHCKNCTRNRGVSPMHLIAVTPPSAVTVTKGEDNITTVGEAVTRCFCKTCGSIIHQGPVSANFRAVSPVMFNLESPQLPKQLLPTMHMNYESRQFDWADNLPKFKCFPGSPMMNNQGEEIDPEKKE